MSKRRKVKLSPEQKEWYKNLQKYLDTINWYQEEPQDLKQEASEGRYAVFCGEGKITIFDWVACMFDRETAEAYMKWNAGGFRLVDLEDLTILEEVGLEE